MFDDVTWRRRSWREKRRIAGTSWTVWTWNLRKVDEWYGLGSKNNFWRFWPWFWKTTVDVKAKYFRDQIQFNDWILFQTWRREGTTVDVESWILLFPLGSPVLEPDFDLEFKVRSFLISGFWNQISSWNFTCVSVRLRVRARLSLSQTERYRVVLNLFSRLTWEITFISIQLSNSSNQYNSHPVESLPVAHIK